MFQKRKTAGVQPAAQAGNNAQKSIHLDYIMQIQNAQISVLANPVETERGWSC